MIITLYIEKSNTTVSKDWIKRKYFILRMRIVCCTQFIMRIEAVVTTDLEFVAKKNKKNYLY
jgi:hypothetical protein